MAASATASTTNCNTDAAEGRRARSSDPRRCGTARGRADSDQAQHAETRPAPAAISTTAGTNKPVNGPGLTDSSSLTLSTAGYSRRNGRPVRGPGPRHSPLQPPICAPFTRGRSLVRSQPRPFTPHLPCGFAHL
jgi:hypothetical protein